MKDIIDFLSRRNSEQLQNGHYAADLAKAFLLPSPKILIKPPW